MEFAKWRGWCWISWVGGVWICMRAAEAFYENETLHGFLEYIAYITM
jgi:hypothetical protein